MQRNAIMKNLFLLSGIFLILTLKPDHVHAELFTATADLDVLHDVESVLISNMKTYITKHEEKLSELERMIEFYDYHHNIASENAAEYLSNPINAFLITKRLTEDWQSVETTMKHDVSASVLKNITEHRKIIKFPTINDLHGAAQALARLQSAYNLETSDMASGYLSGIKYSNEFLAHDCFEIGHQLYIAKDYRYALTWLLEAQARQKEETEHDEELTVNILAYLSFTHQRAGNYLQSFTVSNELLQQYPVAGQLALERVNDINRLNSIIDYEKYIANLTSLDVGQPIEIKPMVYDMVQKIRYEKLCREDIKLTPKQKAPLRCRYVSNRPYLRIAPLKLEEAFLDPYIVTYIDVLYDSEIQTIKQLAQPNFQRAKIQYLKMETQSLTNERTSKAAWLTGDQHPHIRNIELRVEDISGLTQSSSENLQVVNYGIGGHYEPHFDFALRGDNVTFASMKSGNRMATVLFYMTDVEQGGATVFPYLNLALWPRKGSAAVWYNLYRSGEGDHRTKHASCPILVGHKWICNKWFHEKGQDQLRPCLLQPDNPPVLDFLN